MIRTRGALPKRTGPWLSWQQSLAALYEALLEGEVGGSYGSGESMRDFLGLR